jgi:hypothetical protein
VQGSKNRNNRAQGRYKVPFRTLREASRGSGRASHVTTSASSEPLSLSFLSPTGDFVATTAVVATPTASFVTKERVGVATERVVVTKEAVVVTKSAYCVTKEGVIVSSTVDVVSRGSYLVMKYLFV